MVQVADQREVRNSPTLALPLLAADVGGTHARVGLVTPGSNGRPGLKVEHYRTYVCAEYPSLGTLLRDYLETLAGPRPERGVVACAGYPVGDGVINPSLAWPVSMRTLERELAFAELALVNDFEAVAHALGYADLDASTLLSGDPDASVQAPTLVIGPGTGLGAALRIPGVPRPTILSTEAGQAALAPRTALELDVLRVLGRGVEHVPNEAVLSGPGLVNLHRALCVLRGSAPALRVPADITQAALAARDALALEALDLFCALLGSVVGDLALLYGARGGVHLAGGILPRIREFLLHSAFVERFLDKGPMRSVLERIPVRLIEHGQLGVIGAANWYFERRPRP